jgi:hypothetical protein
MATTSGIYLWAIPQGLRQSPLPLNANQQVNVGCSTSGFRRNFGTTAFETLQLHWGSARFLSDWYTENYSNTSIYTFVVLALRALSKSGARTTSAVDKVVFHSRLEKKWSSNCSISHGQVGQHPFV